MTWTPRLVLIGGPSGAGKTYFAEALRDSLGEERCVLLAMDDYYRDLRGLSAEERSARNFDHPEALDWGLLTAHVQTLCSGSSIDAPSYDFASHLRTSGTRGISPRPLVLLEGIHALMDGALVDFAAVTVFVEAPRSLCLERRIARDVSERGRARESVIQQFNEFVWPMAEAHVLPSRERADVVVTAGSPIEGAVADVSNRIDA